MSEGRAPRRRRREPARPRGAPLRLRWQALLLPAGLALAFVAVVYVVGQVYRLWSPAGDIVVVPSFVGAQYADAQSVAANAHLGVHIVARKPDYHARKDQVVGQLPAAGEHVREGRVVDVVVSDGAPYAKVPNLANMSVRDATVALENARLDAGAVTSQADEDVAEGTVLSQRPDAFSSVPAGTKVDLVVAKGRPIVYAPNFVGLSLAEAVAAAKDARIVLASPVPLPIAPSAPPKGVIVTQDPPPGQQLGLHDRIVLQVSGGEPPTPEPLPTMPPAVTGAGAATASPSVPGASAAPSATAGGTPAPRGMRVSVALPQSQDIVRIRVVLLDANGSHTLYDQQTRGGITLSFDLSVAGAGTLQTFVGDSLVNSTPL